MSRTQGAATATPVDKAVPASDVGATAAPPARSGPDWAVVVLGAAIVAAAAVILWDGTRVAQREVRYGLPPGLVPYAVGGGLGLMGLAVAVEGYRGLFPQRDEDRIQPIVWIVGGLVVQIVLLNVAGFSAATACVFSGDGDGAGARAGVADVADRLRVLLPHLHRVLAGAEPIAAGGAAGGRVP